MGFSLILCVIEVFPGLVDRYRPIKVCKLQSSYICGDFKNQTKNNEAYNGTKIGNYFRNGLK